MAEFLANENTPREAVLAARNAGHDVKWMVELQPGAGDQIVLEMARSDRRVLITFHKDFGSLPAGPRWLPGCHSFPPAPAFAPDRHLVHRHSSIAAD